MRGVVALLAVLATVSNGVPTHAASGDSAAAVGLLLRGQGAQGRGRISTASSSSSLSSGSVESVAWPGWPDDDDDDQDGALLPLRSGDVVNLQWQAGGLFCNTQDVDLSELQTGGSTTSTNTNGVVRNVLMCAEAKPAGPREGLLVFGKDFMSNKIKEGGAFYLKAQRVAKFCAPRALGGGGPLVVVCDKLHYDPSSEWVAHLPEASDAQHAGKQAAGDDAPAVIYLSPAKAKGGSGGREPRPLGCAPLGPHGAVLCDEGIRLRDHDAALLVVASDGGGYQVTRGGKGKGKGDEPAKLPFRTGSNVVLTSPYLKRACDTVDNPPYPYVRTSTADDELYEVYSYGPDSYGPDSYGPGTTGDDADGGGYYPYPSGSGGRGGRDSPEQYAVYCNASIPDDKSSPWPYTAGAASAGTGTALDEQQGAGAAAVTAAVGRKGLIGADRVQSYGSADVAGGAAVEGEGEAEQLGGNSQWDLAGFVLLGTDFTSPDVYDGSAVFLKNQNARKMCRVVTKDEADELAAAAAAAADEEEEEEADGAAAGGDAEEAELDGAAQAEGGLGRRRRRRPTLVAGQVVCDQMRSSKKTEFVIELVEPRKGGRGKRSSSSNGGVNADEEELAEAASGGEEDAAADGGSGKWPSGDDRHDGGRDSGDDWPGKRGKDGTAVHVEVRLRAPGNGMRYCAPDRRLRGSPMLCDIRPSDLDHDERLAAAATFRLVDATPSHPWGPPV